MHRHTVSSTARPLHFYSLHTPTFSSSQASVRTPCTLRSASVLTTLHTTLKTLNTLYPAHHSQYTVVSILYTLDTVYCIVSTLYSLHTLLSPLYTPTSHRHPSYALNRSSECIHMCRQAQTHTHVLSRCLCNTRQRTRRAHMRTRILRGARAPASAAASSTKGKRTMNSATGRRYALQRDGRQGIQNAQCTAG